MREINCRTYNRRTSHLTLFFSLFPAAVLGRISALVKIYLYCLIWLMTCFKVNISNLRQAPPDFLLLHWNVLWRWRHKQRTSVRTVGAHSVIFFFSQLKSVCLKTMLVFLTSVMLTGPAKWQVKMNQSWTRPNYFGFAEWLTKDALTTSLGTWVKLHIIILLWTDSISECTVCRSLKQMGYRRANRVPLLSAQIRKMKLQFG